MKIFIEIMFNFYSNMYGKGKIEGNSRSDEAARAWEKA